MIHSLNGTLSEKEGNKFVIALTLGGRMGMSFRLKSSVNVVKSLPEIGENVNVLTYMHVREDAMELYGFLHKEELDFFEMLIGISGIGPKSALGIMGIENVDKIKSAISEGRVELLTKASGVGKKTAERVILELRNKFIQPGSEKIVGVMESDRDIIEALSNLGYSITQARAALAKVDPTVIAMDERIKSALRLLRK